MSATAQLVVSKASSSRSKEEELKWVLSGTMLLKRHQVGSVSEGCLKTTFVDA